MYTRRENHCQNEHQPKYSNPHKKGPGRTKRLTPTHIERPGARKTITYNLQHIRIALRLRQIRKAKQQALQRRRPDTEEHKHVHDQELIIPGHDLVMDRGEGDDGVCFFGDEEEDERDEKGEESDEDGGEEGLDKFFFPGMGLEIVVLFDQRRDISRSVGIRERHKVSPVQAKVN